MNSTKLEQLINIGLHYSIVVRMLKTTHTTMSSVHLITRGTHG